MSATTEVRSKTDRIDLQVDGMHCASCIARIEKALSEVEGVEGVTANLATGRATIVGAGLDRARLSEAVEGAGYSIAEDGDFGRARFAIEGMHCASCVSSIEGSLGATPGVAETSVNLATEEATVVYEPDRVGVDDILGAIEAAGYQGRVLGGQDSGGEEDSGSERERRARAELRTLRARFIFAALVGALLLLLTFVWSPLGERATMWLMKFSASSITSSSLA